MRCGGEGGTRGAKCGISSFVQPTEVLRDYLCIYCY